MPMRTILRRGARWAPAVAVLLLAQVARAGQPAPVSRYLVDGRVYVTVLYRHDGRAGDLAWRDTVAGVSGDAPFRVAADGGLEVTLPSGRTARAHVFPHLALVVEVPPWGGGRAPALGVSVD